MYFKLLSSSTSWRLTFESGRVLDVEQSESGKIKCVQDTFDSIEQLIRSHPGAALTFIGPKDEAYQLETTDGDKYKVRREDGKLKLWGRTIKVTFFEDWGSVFSHFGEIFLKNIEAFEVPEYICTDSKGRYVATIRRTVEGKDFGPPIEWTVLVKDEENPSEEKVHHRGGCLNAAFEHVLRSTTI